MSINLNQVETNFKKLDQLASAYHAACFDAKQKLKPGIPQEAEQEKIEAEYSGKIRPVITDLRVDIPMVASAIGEEAAKQRLWWEPKDNLLFEMQRQTFAREIAFMDGNEIQVEYDKALKEDRERSTLLETEGVIRLKAIIRGGGVSLGASQARLTLKKMAAVQNDRLDDRLRADAKRVSLFVKMIDTLNKIAGKIDGGSSVPIIDILIILKFIGLRETPRGQAMDVRMEQDLNDQVTDLLERTNGIKPIGLAAY